MIVYSGAESGGVMVYMNKVEMKELRGEMKSWDGLIELGEVAAALLKELMEVK